MKKVIEKDKFIIYNDENRILTFSVENYNKILIPSYMKNSMFYFNRTAIKILECLGSDGSEFEYLKTIPYLEKRRVRRNGMLKEELFSCEKNYFYWNIKITDTKYFNLVETLKREGAEVEFLSYEEIKAILECDEIDIDEYLIPILEELNDKFPFKKDYKSLVKKG